MGADTPPKKVLKAFQAGFPSLHAEITPAALGKLLYDEKTNPKLLGSMLGDHNPFYAALAKSTQPTLILLVLELLMPFGNTCGGSGYRAKLLRLNESYKALHAAIINSSSSHRNSHRKSHSRKSHSHNQDPNQA